MAAKKYLSLVSGTITEVQASASSAGAGDDGKLVALNGSGVLAASIVNSTVTSAGAGDTGKIVALDAAGLISSTMMPVGVGADTKTFVASETLAAGDLVNIWDDSGTPKARKADASGGVAKRAVGFVLSGFASAATATVYFDGTITGLSGLTGGVSQFLSGSSAGTPTATAPSTSAYIVQGVGRAVCSTELSFEPEAPIVLA